MSELVADCPRCGAKNMTFDLKDENYIGQEYNWKRFYEVFSICRHCAKSTVFILDTQTPESVKYIGNGSLTSVKGAVNGFMHVNGFISIKDVASVVPPQYLPTGIEAVFREGATCLAVGCYNAAGTMFRLCVDLATKGKLPAKQANQPEPPGLNADVRGKLAFRLRWLFDHRHLPEDLRDLSTCVKDDGNDGAHEGTLDKHAASDLLDFTTELLERMFTEPKNLQLAKERRDSRRADKQKVTQAPAKTKN